LSTERRGIKGRAELRAMPVPEVAPDLVVAAPRLSTTSATTVKIFGLGDLPHSKVLPAFKLKDVFS
jgi:hypothetical protein